jgi:hypothetical protein
LEFTTAGSEEYRRRETTMLRFKYVAVIGVFCIFGAACDNTPTATPLPAVQTWIDKPLNGSTIPLAPYGLLFHAASPSGVAEFEVSVNGAVVDTVTPTSTESGGAEYGTLFLGEHTWTPSAPGTYLISVRAKSSAGPYGSPAIAQVTIESEVEKVEEAALVTATPTPELIQLSPPEYSEENIYHGRNNCGAKELTIRIMSSNPEIHSVVLFYRLSDTESETKSEWTSLAMNPVSGGYFTASLQSETDFPDYRDYKKAYVQVQFVALDSDGEEVTRTEVLSDVTLEVCYQ